MSCFTDVELVVPREIYRLIRSYSEDTFKDKVDLGAGAYRTDEGEPWVLPVVREAEKALASDNTLNKEYLPVLGIDSFTTAATKILLGENSKALKENRAFGVQSLSGCGALSMGAIFLARVLGRTIFYYSDPTWGNHEPVFNSAGFKESRKYRYWSKSTRGIDFEGFLEDLRNAPEHSVIILHPCAHNPTGCDPTAEQWKEIADVMEERRLFPFFDCAYQGFATGDLDRDASTVRYFVERGFEMFCAQSFAKNFGLYNERTGNLTVVMNNPTLIPAVKSQIAKIISAIYLTPPSHGARIISYVLTNPELCKQWKANVKTMAARVIEMRKALRESLEKIGTPGDWSHITQQTGMFSFSGLNEAQSMHMVKKYHIYMLSSGRINMSGITPSNVDYIARAIHESVTSLSQP